jgi:glycerophosphoryl diester phosphodiesterase
MDFPRGEVRVIGHRGAAALAPENSLAAIGAAAAAGAHAVELDVLRAADGSLVLAHGPAVPAGAPALDEALGLAARLGLAVQVDVKDAGLEREVVEALARAGLRERSFVSAHAVEILRAFAAADGGITRALSYPEDRHGATESPYLRPFVRPALALLRAVLPYRLPRRLRAAGAAVATLNVDVVTPRVVAACTRADAAVCAWTVADAATARRLVEAGVAAIITDDPRILVGGTTRA